MAFSKSESSFDVANAKRNPVDLQWHQAQSWLAEEFHVFMTSRKIRHLEENPSDALFKTHRYDFEIRISSAFAEASSRAMGASGFLSELKLMKIDEETGSYEEYTICNRPIITFEQCFNPSDNTCTIALVWPEEKSRVNFKGTFFFCINVFGRADNDTFRRLATKFSSSFAIFSKIDVFLRRKRSGPSTAVTATNEDDAPASKRRKSSAAATAQPATVAVPSPIPTPPPIPPPPLSSSPFVFNNNAMVATQTTPTSFTPSLPRRNVSSKLPVAFPMMPQVPPQFVAPAVATSMMPLPQATPSFPSTLDKEAEMFLQEIFEENTGEDLVASLLQEEPQWKDIIQPKLNALAELDSGGGGHSCGGGGGGTASYGTPSMTTFATNTAAHDWTPLCSDPMFTTFSESIQDLFSPFTTEPLVGFASSGNFVAVHQNAASSSPGVACNGGSLQTVDALAIQTCGFIDHGFPTQ